MMIIIKSTYKGVYFTYWQGINKVGLRLPTF